MADEARRETVPEPPVADASPALQHFGGRWWTVEASGERSVTWTASRDAMIGQSRLKAINSYWAKRQAGRPGGAATSAVPSWDTRVLPKLGGKRRASKPVDVFRAQLWWDHLPSPEVMHRGVKQVDPAATCDRCQEQGVASTWHLLAECKSEELVAVRTAATELMRRKSSSDGASEL